MRFSKVNKSTPQERDPRVMDTEQSQFKSMDNLTLSIFSGFLKHKSVGVCVSANFSIMTKNTQSHLMMYSLLTDPYWKRKIS